MPTQRREAPFTPCCCILEDMTLGLAVADSDGIFAAIESEGLPARGTTIAALTLNSKILELQSGPEILVLAAGGLDHWSHVAGCYVRQRSLTDAADEVRHLLDECMGPENRAFGLLFGFDGCSPQCYRINRFLGEDATSLSEERLADVQPIGDPTLALPAKEDAERDIAIGTDCLASLVGAIERRFPAKGMRRPTHVRVIRP
jgi:hypothetical protein